MWASTMLGIASRAAAPLCELVLVLPREHAWFEFTIIQIRIETRRAPPALVSPTAGSRLCRRPITAFRKLPRPSKGVRDMKGV